MKKKNQMIEVHAKVETTQPTTLEQVWGYNELARYGTLVEQEYVQQLSEMNRPDLEKECRRVGILVVESTARIKENLVKEFGKYVSFLKKPIEPKKTPITVSDAARKILAEGR